MLFIHHLLGLDTQGSMRYRAQPGFIDQLAGNTANAIGFIFDAHQRFLEVIDVIDLAAGHLANCSRSILILPSSMVM